MCNTINMHPVKAVTYCNKWVWWGIMYHYSCSHRRCPWEVQQTSYDTIWTKQGLLYVLRSDSSLPKIYQWPNVVLTESVIVKRFSDGLVIRLKRKWTLQKNTKIGVKGSSWKEEKMWERIGKVTCIEIGPLHPAECGQINPSCWKAWSDMHLDPHFVGPEDATITEYTSWVISE